MNNKILILGTTLLAFFFSSANAYNYGNDQAFVSASLKDLRNVVIKIDTPIGQDYEMNNYVGISKADLQERIERRLRETGLNIISLEDSLDDPEVILLNLKFRWVLDHGLVYHVYHYTIDLSVKQKAPLPQGNNSFFSVEIWSNDKRGAVLQSDLSYLNNYSMQLVDSFIQQYQAQN
jgi:hypothetical protein